MVVNGDFSNAATTTTTVASRGELIKVVVMRRFLRSEVGTLLCIGSIGSASVLIEREGQLLGERRPLVVLVVLVVGLVGVPKLVGLNCLLRGDVGEVGKVGELDWGGRESAAKQSSEAETAAMKWAESSS